MEDIDYLNNFSLDMVSTDMNFEQAYSMYNNLQQEHALSSVDNLQKAQRHASPTVFDHGVENDSNFSYHRSKILNMQMNLQEDHLDPNHHIQSGTDMQRSHSMVPTHSQNGFNDDASQDGEEDQDSQDEEDFDKFFSNTESNALEKFLDNLANPNHSTNPLDLYHHDFNFKPKKDVSLKSDISNVFAHPPKESMYGKQSDSAINTQLPTPESRQSSIDEDNLHPEDLEAHGKRSFDQNHSYQPTDLLHSSSLSSMEDDSGSPLKKRKRSTTKPLLSLKQKRLNHSHSEQKRRQLCKLAYERCLRLITDFETYSKQPPINKKSKRKLFTKEGLPNLSKHCALVKISGEITKIKSKNDQLRQLLHN